MAGTGSVVDDGPVNLIAEALFLRLCRAIRAEQAFKVVVVLPCSPAFEGEIEAGVRAYCVCAYVVAMCKFWGGGG